MTAYLMTDSNNLQIALVNLHILSGPCVSYRALYLQLCYYISSGKTSVVMHFPPIFPLPPLTYVTANHCTISIYSTYWLFGDEHCGQTLDSCGTCCM